MHKTYSDTYQIQGFTGGYWAYATNTNETAGVPYSTPTDETVPKSQRRLAVYYLGWESIEVGLGQDVGRIRIQVLINHQLHEDGTRTEAFAEEINKLLPYFGPDSGAWYAMLRQHK